MAAKSKKKPVAKKKVGPVPKSYHTVTATMNQTDAAGTIEFCKQAFGAKVRSTMPGPNGKLLHAEIQIGDSVIMLSDSIQEAARVSSIFLYVPDVDKVFARAIAAGATAMMPPANQFWGDRFARVVDGFGNLWAIATHLENLTPAQMKKRAAEAMKQMAGTAN